MGTPTMLRPQTTTTRAQWSLWTRQRDTATTVMAHSARLGAPLRAGAELQLSAASTPIHTPPIAAGQAPQDPHSWTSSLEERFSHAFAVVQLLDVAKRIEMMISTIESTKTKISHFS